MESVLAVDDGGGLEPQHRRVVYGNIVYAYANKDGIVYNDGEDLSNHHLTFENHRELVEENHSLLPSGSVGDFSNQNGFSGLNQDEEEERWQEQQNEGEEQKRSEEGEETETDDGDIFLSVEEPSQSGHQQQQEVLIYDEESGEYQKYLYIADEEDEPEDEEHAQDLNELNQILIGSSQEEEDDENDGGNSYHFENELANQALDDQVNEEESDSYVFVQESEIGSVKEDSGDFLAQFVRAEGLGEVQAEDAQIESHIRTLQSEDKTTFSTKKRKLLTTMNGDETSASSSGTTWVKCDKCQRTIRLDEFAAHYQEVHAEITPAEKNSQFKVCSLCNKMLSRKDYLTHFKVAHTDVRLGCPKCPQTYHSPELLNVHYRHFHAQQQQQQQHQQIEPCKNIRSNATVPKDTVQKVTRCHICSALVRDLKRHINNLHPAQDSIVATAANPVVQRGKTLTTLHCDICNKTYHSQREFTNHRRRKDFCKPPFVEPPPPKRRIGIIRRSL